ncbi:MAG: outer membrane lipoprotein-sorting protein [Spirochaetales bacterium]|uniref:Outer membrane lipoprotein-sorting protein n=1 Tax=Candidatus Thalassospirochaeta sargassi TaxID=3119039 RepID=A0AAJ1IFT9_9SPIO|nr:outer membrane lipoprotein-sorting protein [Spirochaetales bacterium]
MTTAVLFFASLGFVFGEPDFDKMLEEIDELGSFEDSDFSCVYTFVSEKPGEETEVTQARMFRRDANEQFVMLILKPEYQKGQGYLKVDDNVWFYDPESRKFTHSSMKENVQNSEARNSDMDGLSLAEDYEVDSWETGKLGNFDSYILTLEALNNEVTYPRLKIWVRTDATIVLKEEDYSLSDRLMRTTYFPKYVKVGDKYVPSQILIVDNLQEGEKTQLTMKNPSTAELPDSVFSKAYIERVNN